jgi:hypothetical protein
MIPTLLPSLERHGRLKLDQADRALVLGVSAATIDRLLVETKLPPPAVSAGGSAFIRRYGVKVRSGRSTTGTIHRRGSARSTWWLMAAHL